MQECEISRENEESKNDFYLFDYFYVGLGLVNVLANS